MNLVVAIIILIAGVTMLFFSVIQLMRALKSKNWPTTEGVILKSEVERASGRDKSRNFRAHVVFEYTVSGRKFTNDRVALSSKLFTSSVQRASKIVSKYKKDQQVTVYYPFQNDQEGILEPGPTREQITGILISLVFVGFGSLLLFLSQH